MNKKCNSSKTGYSDGSLLATTFSVMLLTLLTSRLLGTPSVAYAIPSYRVAASVTPRHQKADLNADLFKAIEANNLEKVKALLDQGADVNARGKDGSPALIYALRNIPIFKLLLERGADPNARLQQSQPRNDMSFPNGMTPLIVASWLGQLEAVQLLLEKGAQVNATDENGWSALMWITTQSMPIENPKVASGAKIAQTLIAKGADIKLKDKSGMTALLMAAHFHHPGVAAVLLDIGADVNTPNAKGETPLMVAIERARYKQLPKQAMAIIKLFLDRGADKNIRDQNGRTALERAETTDLPEIVSLLRTGKIPSPPPRVHPRPSRTLLSLAMPMLKMDSPVSPYRWRSNTQVILLKDLRQGEFIKRVWFHHDLKTGRQTQDTRLKETSHNTIRLSPDGRQVLSYGDESSRLTWKVMDLQRGTTRQHPVSQKLLDRFNIAMMYPQTLGWLPDSRSWVWLHGDSTEEDMHALVFRMEAPGLVRDVKVTLPKRKDTSIPETKPEVLLGFSPKGYAISTTGRATIEASERIDLFEFRLDKTSTAARKFSVRLPIKARADARLSPKGDRFAWLIAVEGNSQDSVELWVSRGDGRGMQGIGYVDVAPGQGDISPSSLQWLPDGKRLSFIYKNRLYTISTE
jgi:ankyrin repeat protein